MQSTASEFELSYTILWPMSDEYDDNYTQVKFHYKSFKKGYIRNVTTYAAMLNVMCLVLHVLDPHRSLGSALLCHIALGHLCQCLACFV